MDYQKQGDDFMRDTNTKMTVKFTGTDLYFDDDKEERDIYRVTLERNGKKYSFRFGQSIAHSSTGAEKKARELDRQGYGYWSPKMRAARNLQKAPTAYDVLSGLTKNDPGTIDDFAADYGYTDVKPSKLQKTYASVVEEWENVRGMFGDVMDKLQEIQ